MNEIRVNNIKKAFEGIVPEVTKEYTNQEIIDLLQNIQKTMITGVYEQTHAEYMKERDLMIHFSSLAEEYGLITADKKDSTGICFIGERNFTNFLKNYLPNTPGDIVNIDAKEVIGKHIGLMYYTIGQRRGLDIGGNAERLFVVGKDLKKNILYVALGEDNDYLVSDSCIIDEVNYLKDKKIDKCTAKFRYRQKDIEVNLEWLEDGNILVKYPQGVKRVTPGQACVLYDKDECIGGGIIKEVRKNNEKVWYL